MGAALEPAGAQATAAAHLISARLLARNTLWNLLGQASPILVALLAIPFLVKGLGVDRFGVLTLAWLLVGYFSLFDLGLGRALTKVVAERLGSGRDGDIPSLVWTALALMTSFGLAGAATLAVLAPWLAGSVLKIPPALITEAIGALWVLAPAVPVVIATTGLRGILEAYQRFDLVNLVRVPMGIFNFAGPLLALPFSNRLEVVFALLVAWRIVALAVHAALCRAAVPSLRGRPRLDRASVRPLVAFGGWMTVSNVISPILVYVDRFVIGALVSMSAVAYYVTPYEMVTKLWMVPAALVGVLFPAFAISLASDRRRAARFLDKGMRYVFLALFPPTIAVVTLAHPGLNLWLGPEFAHNGFRVLQWLAVGVFVNALAQVPFAAIQGAGRADFTAKLHLLELPCYLLALWWMVDARGIVGAAMAWVLRIGVDAAVTTLVASRILGEGRLLRHLVAAAAVALAAMAFGSSTRTLAASVGFLAAALAFFVPAAWMVVLGDEERSAARSLLRSAPEPR